MKKILVKIGTVDMDGFCGRELHPEETDSGKTGRLVEMKTFDNEFAEEFCEEFDENQETFMMFTLVLDDGRIREFVEFEIESIEMTD